MMRHEGSRAAYHFDWFPGTHQIYFGIDFQLGLVLHKSALWEEGIYLRAGVPPEVPLAMEIVKNKYMFSMYCAHAF